MKFTVGAFLALFLIATGADAKRQAVAKDAWPTHVLLAAAREANRPQFDFARRIGARVLLSADDTTFSLYWSSTASSDAPVVVTLHGSDGFATAELFHWYPVALEQGYAILALQWWLNEPEKYLTDEQIYEAVTEMLIRVGARPGRNVLHGFSRGSARSYAVMFLDRRTQAPWFLMAIANAGGAQLSYPLYAAIELGTYGAKAYDETHWVLYCGTKDESPNRSGCSGMRRTEDWLSRHGGKVELLIEDASGGHVGFQQNPDNIRRTVQVFRDLLATMALTSG